MVGHISKGCGDHPEIVEAAPDAKVPYATDRPSPSDDDFPANALSRRTRNWKPVNLIMMGKSPLH